MCVLGFPGGSELKNPPANAGDTCSIPGSEKSPGEEIGKPLQYFCLGNSMDIVAYVYSSMYIYSMYSSIYSMYSRL